jgi:hypothetical protein
MKAITPMIVAIGLAASGAAMGADNTGNAPGGTGAFLTPEKVSPAELRDARPDRVPRVRKVAVAFSFTAKCGRGLGSFHRYQADPQPKRMGEMASAQRKAYFRFCA